MEELIYQYPCMTILIWNLLNVLHVLIYSINKQFFKRLTDSAHNFEIKSWKTMLKFLAWLAFGTIYLWAYKNAYSTNAVSDYEYLAWVGAIYFCIIGFLIKDICFFVWYLASDKNRLKAIYSSYEFFNSPSMFFQSLDFFGYSILIFISFLISHHPFLLGGTFGLAFDGVLCLLRLKKSEKKNQNRSLR